MAGLARKNSVTTENAATAGRNQGRRSHAQKLSPASAGLAAAGPPSLATAWAATRAASCCSARRTRLGASWASGPRSASRVTPSVRSSPRTSWRQASQVTRCASTAARSAGTSSPYR